MSWQTDFQRELERCSVTTAEAADLAQSAQSEADAAGATPASMYGPAVIHAREIASALRDEEPARSPHLGPATPEILLRLRNVHVKRGRRQILRGIDLEVRRGEVVAVVGANGSGKSTLLQVCAGLLKPTRGTVERVADFGYAPQAIVQAPLLSIDEHLRLFGAAGGMSTRRAVSTGGRVLAELGWRAHLGQLLGTLSGGSQQKVNVALAQLHSPSLLLLDEPYQGFDALAYADLWSLITSWRQAGAGILLITHLLRDAPCDRVLELANPEEARP